MGTKRQALDKQATVISPMGLEAAQRIDALFEIERTVNGLVPDQRLPAKDIAHPSSPV